MNSSFFQFPAKFCRSFMTPLLKSGFYSINAYMGCTYQKCLYGLLFALNRRLPASLFFPFSVFLYLAINQKKKSNVIFYPAHCVFCSPFCWRFPQTSRMAFGVFPVSYYISYTIPVWDDGEGSAIWLVSSNWLSLWLVKPGKLH